MLQYTAEGLVFMGVAMARHGHVPECPRVIFVILFIDVLMPHSQPPRNSKGSKLIITQCAGRYLGSTGGGSNEILN